MTDFNGYTELNDERVGEIARLAHANAETVIDLLYADWNNPGEHNTWLQTASDEEIAGWIRDCTR
mgnify:CR=1 FL=1